MIKGFGGIFWRTRNLEATKQWYSDTLKLDINNWNGTVIQPTADNQTAFSFFDQNDDYFPTEQQVMLNFQVENLDDMLRHLEQLGVPLARGKETGEFGSFIWIQDPEGRLIELWQK
ncbi:VOC family protein [Paenibacillus athensensis]|uniref:Glyoxalase n=1 Tax=Paenibacillus athensensis TaxID=1967502 RepID=A0A4Y8Q9R1_9BACL|nr:VOC family protein [Paenibacillus athensensis]MCD1258966.1 VOC family protein [Paenibacillus athensensis]